MVIRILGNDEGDQIIFENGMKIKISYGILAFKDKPHLFKWGERFTSDGRRITLYDSDNKIITDLIEPNPDEMDIDFDINDDPDTEWLNNKH